MLSKLFIVILHGVCFVHNRLNSVCTQDDPGSATKMHNLLPDSNPANAHWLCIIDYGHYRLLPSVYQQKPLLKGMALCLSLHVDPA